MHNDVPGDLGRCVRAMPVVFSWRGLIYRPYFGFCISLSDGRVWSRWINSNQNAMSMPTMERIIHSAGQYSSSTNATFGLRNGWRHVPEQYCHLNKSTASCSAPKRLLPIVYFGTFYQINMSGWRAGWFCKSFCWHQWVSAICLSFPPL